MSVDKQARKLEDLPPRVHALVERFPRETELFVLDAYLPRSRRGHSDGKSGADSVKTEFSLDRIY
jgi:hypothetical protein